MTHKELVERAARWLYGSAGCAAVLSEFTSSACATIPDAIGWKNRWSILVECKTSRSDFFADKKKPDRMGQERWYMTPPKLVAPDELPPGWGLAYVYEKQVRRVVTPPMSVFRNGRLVLDPLASAKEIALVVSFLRRVATGEGLAPAFRSLFTGIDVPPVTYRVRAYGELMCDGFPTVDTVVEHG